MRTTETDRSTIIPMLRYKDARAAIDWLTSAFGFAEHLVVPGVNGKIVHAQLTLGNGMIMLGRRLRRQILLLLGSAGATLELRKL